MLIDQMVIVEIGFFAGSVLRERSLAAAQEVLEQPVFFVFGEERVSGLPGKIMKITA